MIRFISHLFFLDIILTRPLPLRCVTICKYVSSSTVLHPTSRPLRTFEKKSNEGLLDEQKERERKKKKETETVREKEKERERERGRATQKLETVCGVWIILSVCLELFEACFPRRLISRYQLLIALPECKFSVLKTEPWTTKDRWRVDVSLHRDAAHTRYISRVPMPRASCRRYIQKDLVDRGTSIVLIPRKLASQ